MMGGRSLHRVPHDARHLADEFMADPFGRASPELHRLLLLFRAEPMEGKYVLICTKPFEEWRLAQMGKPGEPPRLLPDYRFSSLEQAERAVFRLRWKKHTGHDLGWGEALPSDVEAVGEAVPVARR
jgi:hypothetical protein